MRHIIQYMCGMVELLLSNYLYYTILVVFFTYWLDDACPLVEGRQSNGSQMKGKYRYTVIRNTYITRSISYANSYISITGDKCERYAWNYQKFYTSSMYRLLYLINSFVYTCGLSIYLSIYEPFTTWFLVFCGPVSPTSVGSFRAFIYVSLM